MAEAAAASVDLQAVDRMIEQLSTKRRLLEEAKAADKRAPFLGVKAPSVEAHQLSSLMVKVVSLPEHQLLLGMVSTDS